MRYPLSLFFLLITIAVSAQTVLTIQGQSYTNSDETWLGVVIPRSSPTILTFKNNSIRSSNLYGYMLQAGDETEAANNNNLDGATITGNRFTWTGTDMKSITHGLFTGHNINVNIKYNYLDHVPMGIIRKSTTNMINTSGGVAYNIIRSTNVGIVVKGMSGVHIYNNTLYQDRTTTETGRGLIDIYTNQDVTPVSVSHNTRIYNNIFYTKQGTACINVMDVESLTGLQSDYNIYYCETGSPRFRVAGSLKTFEEWQAMGYDTHSRVVNPNFKDFVNFVPAARLNYGTNLGTTWDVGLSVNAKWGTTDPEKATQNGTWQVGAIIYKEVVVETPPPPAPVYTGSVINDATPSRLEISFNLTLASIIPAASAFTVRVNNATRSVSSVSISGSKVFLTLASPVVYGDAVTVAYSKPSSNPLQTPEGGQVASYTAQTVTNNRQAPPPNQPPVISISSPTKSEAFVAPATITIDAAASDADGSVIKVEFYNGTVKLGERTSSPFSFTWKDVPEGTYSITAAATDNANARTVTAAVSVVVEKASPAVNQLPVVAILSPAHNSSFEAPAEVTLTAEASDSDGIISKVEYFSGTEKIGESLSAPWSLSINFDREGTYEITAVATDNRNAVTVSDPVRVLVTSEPRRYPDLINLFPNPNNGRFSVEINPDTEIEPTSVTIVNLAGKTVYSDIMTPEETSRDFDITSAPPGNYIILVSGRDRILTAKQFAKY
jgi:uncharacterized repeat protein (TIGR02059 family)